MTRDVIVAGGGISGLTTAWRLRQAGVDVALLEANDRVGGCMRTDMRDGFLIEKGPFNIIVRDPAFEELLTELSDDLKVVSADPTARARFLYRKGRLMRVPSNPGAMVTTPLLSMAGKCRAMAGVVWSRRGTGKEWTIADFATRRFGREVSDTMVSAVIAGILAGDIGKLSVNACFPSLARFDREARSPFFYGMSKAFGMMSKKSDKPRRRWRGLVSIDRGLGAISDAVAARLGADVHTGRRVETVTHDGANFEITCRGEGGGGEVYRCRRLVLALPAPEAARVIAPLSPPAGELLASIESASLVVVNLAFKSEDVGHPMSGFGFLVPHNEPGFPLMGVLWSDSAFPHHGKAGHRLVRVFIGGTRTPDVMKRRQEGLVATAREALRDVLDIRGTPTLVDVCPYPAAIPQYHLGHLDKIERLRNATAAVPGLHLVGNYLEGVSINDCVRLGKRVAGEMVDADRTRPAARL